MTRKPTYNIVSRETVTEAQLMVVRVFAESDGKQEIIGRLEAGDAISQAEWSKLYVDAASNRGTIRSGVDTQALRFCGRLEALIAGSEFKHVVALTTNFDVPPVMLNLYGQVLSFIARNGEPTSTAGWWKHDESLEIPEDVAYFVNERTLLPISG